jgi:hypothetical protein
MRYPALATHMFVYALCLSIGFRFGMFWAVNPMPKQADPVAFLTGQQDLDAPWLRFLRGDPCVPLASPTSEGITTAPQLQSPVPHETTAASLHQQPNKSFSACLLVMDENFRFYEWLSYHYHVLPLRYVVIAVDPGSVISPEPVLEMFRKELNMTILTWNDSDYGDWEPLPADSKRHIKTNRYLLRQQRFLEKCMDHLYQQGRTWTALWDVDEYIVFNGYNRSIGNVTTPNDLTEPGTVLNYIEQAEAKPCYPMMRLEVGTKEDPPTLTTISIPNLDPLRFDTLRYRYKNVIGYKKVGNGNGKVFLNVQRVDFPNTVFTPHRPAMTICPVAIGDHVVQSPFLMLHYVGSWEAYNFRVNDSRKGAAKRFDVWKTRSMMSYHLQPKTETWMEGFIKNVSTPRAWRLLRLAGLPEGFNGSVSQYEALIANEALRYL